MSRIFFPRKDKWKWGAGSSAYQIEGIGPGRGPSIWDPYCQKLPQPPGNFLDGKTNADRACGHYERYREDVGLMHELGLDAYRFSISWPRVVPEKNGIVNSVGLDFYSKLVDELLAKGIEPCATLYHFELPLWLQVDHKGWQSREAALRFADYCQKVVQHLGDRVKQWFTINEPSLTMLLGHCTGVHAPGLQCGPDIMLPVIHHQLLAHGYAMQVVHNSVPNAEAGIAHFQSQLERINNLPFAFTSKAYWSEICIKWVLDPLLCGRYPLSARALDKLQGLNVIRPGDMEMISQPMDFFGLNYYLRQVCGGPKWNSSAEHVRGFEQTTMGWDVDPDAFEKLLLQLKQKYPNLPPIYITENGATFKDTVVNGRINDERRINFLRQHLQALHRAMEKGVDVRGYFLWSLMDSFEWGKSYDVGFGIVHVDFDSLVRTIKDSGRWYAQVIANNGFDLDEAV